MSVASQPAFILQYGDPKTGKTTDDLYSFPRAFWIAGPGALKPSVGVCGYEPDSAAIHDAESIRDAAERIEALPKGRYDAVVVDDLTVLVDRTVATLQRKGIGGYDLWGIVHRHLLNLREIARRAGIHVVLNAHAIHPRIENGISYKGGPALPGKTLPYKLPAACDLVVRATPGDVGYGWKVVYRASPDDTGWISGDRHNVTPDPSPMNLGEILRLAGRGAGRPEFGPRRLPGLEWQEPVIAKAAAAIVSKLDDSNEIRAILRATFEHAMKKHTTNEQHAIWTVRDAYDRAILVSALSQHRRKLYDL